MLCWTPVSAVADGGNGVQRRRRAGVAGGEAGLELDRVPVRAHETGRHAISVIQRRRYPPRRANRA